MEKVNNIDKLRARLDGKLIAATPVPFDARGNLHQRAHQAYLDHMRKQPTGGVAVWAHTGRGLMLREETAVRVLRDWRAALPRSVVIAGAGAHRNCEADRATAEAVAMAERAAACGADALLVYAPTHLRDHPRRDAMILAHHRQLAGVGLPLVLFYLYDAAGGISYSDVLLDELLSLPEVVGIKMATLDSVMTYQRVARRLTHNYPQQLLITGEDRFLGYSLHLGARAALIGMGAICCGLQNDLIEAHTAKNAARFWRLSERVDLLGETIFTAPMEGYIQRLLLALAHQGVIPRDAVYDPWGPTLDAGESAAIGRTLDALERLGE